MRFSRSKVKNEKYLKRKVRPLINFYITLGEYLHDAVVQLNAERNSMYMYKIAHFLKYQTQVVAGIKYIITVELAPTGCRKDKLMVCCLNLGDNLFVGYMFFISLSSHILFILILSIFW